MRASIFGLFLFLFVGVDAHANVLTCPIATMSFDRALKKYKKKYKIASDVTQSTTASSNQSAKDAIAGKGAAGAGFSEKVGTAFNIEAIQNCIEMRNIVNEKLTKVGQSCQQSNISAYNQRKKNFRTLVEKHDLIPTICTPKGLETYGGLGVTMGKVANAGAQLEGSAPGSAQDSPGALEKTKSFAKKWGPTALVGVGAALVTSSLMKDDDKDKKREPAQSDSTDEDSDSNADAQATSQDVPSAATTQISPMADAPTSASTPTIAASTKPTQFDPINTGVPSNNEGDQGGARDQSVTNSVINEDCLGDGSGASTKCLDNLMAEPNADHLGPPVDTAANTSATAQEPAAPAAQIAAVVTSTRSLASATMPSSCSLDSKEASLNCSANLACKSGKWAQLGYESYKICYSEQYSKYKNN